jgi:hypothetical protein
VSENKKNDGEMENKGYNPPPKASKIPKKPTPPPPPKRNS